MCSEPEDRDEAMDMLDEKRRGLRTKPKLSTTQCLACHAAMWWDDTPDPLCDECVRRENASLRLLVQQLRDPSCPIVYGQRVTWVEFKAISEDGP